MSLNPSSSPAQAIAPESEQQQTNTLLKQMMQLMLAQHQQSQQTLQQLLQHQQQTHLQQQQQPQLMQFPVATPARVESHSELIAVTTRAPSVEPSMTRRAEPAAQRHLPFDSLAESVDQQSDEPPSGSAATYMPRPAHTISGAARASSVASALSSPTAA